MIYSASLELRKNLWQCFIQPLFEFTLPLLSFDGTNSNLANLQRLLRNTFRSFTLLSKSTSIEDMNFLMGYDIIKRERFIRYVSAQKWNFRVKGEIYDSKSDKYASQLLPTDPVVTKYLPKEAALYSNLLCAVCPKCKGLRMSASHLWLTHGLKIESLKEITLRVRSHLDKQIPKIARSKRVAYAAEIYEKGINRLKAFMNYTTS